MSGEPDDLEQEQAWVLAAQAGDRQALGRILRKHGPRVYRSVLLPRLGRAAVAEEALSATYTKVIEHFARFEWQAVGVYPWIRQIAFNVAIDLLRRSKREQLFDPEVLEASLVSSGPVSSAELEERDLAEARTRVTSLLGQLNPRYASALRLRVLDGRSREDCAAELGVSLATFDVVLHRSMAALKRQLQLASEEESP